MPGMREDELIDISADELIGLVTELEAMLKQDAREVRSESDAATPNGDTK
ncbi:hypothetical protein [Burkholderia pseudomallei]|nr:hypothetical protein [Burkholderia pseudomallei]